MPATDHEENSIVGQFTRRISGLQGAAAIVSNTAEFAADLAEESFERLKKSIESSSSNKPSVADIARAENQAKIHNIEYSPNLLEKHYLALVNKLQTAEGRKHHFSALEKLIKLLQKKLKTEKPQQDHKNPAQPAPVAQAAPIAQPAPVAQPVPVARPVQASQESTYEEETSNEFNRLHDQLLNQIHYAYFAHNQLGYNEQSNVYLEAFNRFAQYPPRNSSKPNFFPEQMPLRQYESSLLKELLQFNSLLNEPNFTQIKEVNNSYRPNLY